MAGIAGAVSIGGFQVTEGYLSWMGAAMSHRSAAPMRTWVSREGRVGLAHLEHPDTTNEIANHGDGHVAVLSGQITNRKEVIAELIKAGISASVTTSDSALFLLSFLAWGGDGFARLHGGYAGVIWENSRRSITLVRSPSGSIPLLHAFHKGRLIFSTEAKGCLADPELPQKLNEEALFHYLTFLAVPPPHTLFAGVSKLEPGTWTRMSPDGDFRTGRFWNLGPRIEETCSLGNEELSQRVLRGTRAALRDTGRKGERLGILLDGGLPASATALGLHKYSPAQVVTYSVLVGDLSPSEVANAKRVNDNMKGLGIPHRVIRVGSHKFQGNLPRLAALQDEPNNRAGDILLSFAAEAGREEGINRFASPLGANAIFLRLNRWAEIAKSARIHERKSITWFREASVGLAKLAKKPMDHKLERMERTLDGMPFYWGYRELFTRDEKFGVLSSRLRHSFQDTSSWQAVAPYWSRFEQTNSDANIEDWMPFLEVALGLPEGLLMRFDQMSHGVGMPHAHPFLKPSLVTDTLALHRLTRGTEALPRTTFEQIFKHLLPDMDILAGAHGTPNRSISAWFFETLAESPKAVMEDFFRQSDILDQQAVRGICGSANNDRRWHLYNFMQWWRTWFGA